MRVAVRAFVHYAVIYEKHLVATVFCRRICGENVGHKVKSFYKAQPVTLVGIRHQMIAFFFRRDFFRSHGYPQIGVAAAMNMVSRRADAARDLYVNEVFVVVATSYEQAEQTAEFFVRNGWGYADALRAEKQPVDVFGKCENFFVAGVGGVVNAVPEKAYPVAHRDGHFGEFSDRAVVISKIFHSKSLCIVSGIKNRKRRFAKMRRKC